jgi:hypothetical protein
MNKEEWRAFSEDAGKGNPAMQVLLIILFELRVHLVTECLFMIIDTLSMLRRDNIRVPDLWRLFASCNYNIASLHASLLQKAPDSSFYQEVKKD